MTVWVRANNQNNDTKNYIAPLKPNRHSEPGVNHGEESHCLVILSLATTHGEESHRLVILSLATTHGEKSNQTVILR